MGQWIAQQQHEAGSGGLDCLAMGAERSECRTGVGAADGGWPTQTKRDVECGGAMGADGREGSTGIRANIAPWQLQKFAARNNYATMDAAGPSRGDSICADPARGS